MTQHSHLKQLATVFTDIPFNRTLGLQLEELNPNNIVMSFMMKSDLVGNYMHGILHGGVISSVLDMAGGMAAMVAAIEKNKDASFEQLAATIGKSSTINLNINYLRPGKGEKFTAKAALLHSGNKISTARMELYNHENILIATGTGSYLIG